MEDIVYGLFFVIGGNNNNKIANLIDWSHFIFWFNILIYLFSILDLWLFHEQECFLDVCVCVIELPQSISTQ